MNAARTIIGVWAVVAVAAPLLGAGEPAGEARTVVLDTSGYWRCFHVLKPAVVIHDDGRVAELPHPSADTAPPPESWRGIDFDDAGWLRQRGATFPSARNTWSALAHWNVGGVYLNMSSPALATIALRAKFRVTDPAKVKALTCSAHYRGGVVLYLNGKELARQHIAPKAGPAAARLAVKYPPEAYLYPDGKLLDHDYRRAEKAKDRYLSRTRHLADVAIPPQRLRKGTNVLAVEVVRAPHHALLLEKLKGLRKPHLLWHKLWDTCSLVGFRMTADAADGLVPNVVRPKGMQIWNSDVLTPDFDLDFGDSAERLRPVEIVATRGGSFSGKVVVGSTETIAGLRATVGAFAAAGGHVIPASAAQVRYARPDGTETAANGHYPAAASRFDGLAESAPKELRVRTKQRTRGNWVAPGQPGEVFGAVCPVWVTVKVPRDAAPGDYEATLTISARGTPPVRVPLRLRVCGFTLPPPREFRTFCELIQSPDSVALHYGVGLWSEEHFRLIERSFRAISAVGAKTVYVPLICHTNLGNAQSMVRWVRKPGGGYTHDFSVLERYLDLYARHCGKPEAVCVGAWEVFLEGGNLTWARTGKYVRHDIIREFDKAKGHGPLVTLYDPKTKQTQDLELPLYTKAAGSRQLWKPLLDELRARMARRGWAGRLVLGYCHDSVPSKEVVAFFKDLMPDVPWMRQAHSRRKDLHGVPYRLQMTVWTPRFLLYPDATSRRGWQGEDIQFLRSAIGSAPAAKFRLLGEMNIMGQQRGFGRFGADFWCVFKDSRGRLSRTCATRYPKAQWRALVITTSLLSPGQTGPLSTARVEMVREGLQECEARIFIEKALLDPTRRAAIGEDLVHRCRQTLARRTLAVLQGVNPHTLSGFLKTGNHEWWGGAQVGCRWYLHSGWQKRSGDLYALASEVAARQSRPQ